MSEGKKLGARGGTLGSREVVGTPKIGPTGGRDPKTYSSISITSYLNLAPPHSPSPPEPPLAPKKFLGPQEVLGAFGNLQQPWVFSETQRPCFPCSPSPPLLPLVHSHPLSPPKPPWVSLGPWNFHGASGRLGSLCKPLAALGLQSDSGALLPLLLLTPSHPLSFPLTLSHLLSLPRPPWISGTFLGPQEDLGALTSLWQPWVFSQIQGTLLPLLPLTPSSSLSLPLAPSHSLSLPRPPWVPGTFLGPQKALGAFTSLQQPLAALGL